MAREDSSVQEIVSLLPATGEMEFSAWQNAIALARKQGRSWLKAKHQGLIIVRTVLNDDETISLYVSRPS